MDVRVFEEDSHFTHFWTTGVWERETGRNVQLPNSAGEIVNLYEYVIELFIFLYLFFTLIYLIINSHISHP